MIELISKDAKYCRKCFVTQSRRVHDAWPYVYMVNQIFESVSDLFVKQISKRIGLLPMALFWCAFLPALLIKRLCIAVFLLIK